jgi:uncharacterized protein with NRDE domain
MCLLVVALEASARYPLVIAANRDEQHARPTEAAAWWGAAAPLLAGRDVRAGGTWLAVDRRGRFAAVTNIREPLRLEAPRSRGALVASYVAGEESAAGFAARAAREDGFGPFNLLLFDGRELHYASNRAAAARLDAGVHAFSNAPRGIDWPKVESARALAEPLLAHDAPLEPLFDLLGERDPQSPPEERYRRAHFLVGPAYGTRCSTVMLVDATGEATFAERTFDATGRLVGEVRERFAIDGER